MPENKGLNIALISLHGLIRGENMELGKDEDTGGANPLCIGIGPGFV
jgi:sucrose-phosphate synthase